MTLEERRLLEEFLGQLMKVPAVQRDRAAAAAIDSAFERQPYAAYLVVQRALLLQQELAASQAEVARLQARLGEAQSAAEPPRFLDPSQWGRAAPTAASSSLRNTGGAAGSFLGQAAAVAAGVAGGAFLFQGLNHLLGEILSEPASGEAAASAGGDWADAGAGDTGFDGGDFGV
jgi:hypothetical protein